MTIFQEFSEAARLFMLAELAFVLVAHLSFLCYILAMDARQLAKRQKILARIQEFTLMDADSGAGARRARYNSALMDADATVP